MASERLSRSGKGLDSPRDSDIFQQNPAPQVGAFSRIPYDYIDRAGCLYWRVSSHATLRDWCAKSVLPELIEHQYDSTRDSIMYVQQGKASRKGKEVFLLAEVGDAITLQSGRDNGLTQEAVVRLAGQAASTSSSYAARRVKWIVLRF
jgi:hypothetical protein